MHPAHPLALLHIPGGLLVALSSRELQFVLQPYHHLIRLAHILATSGFFGAIALLDLRLIGGRGGPSLRSLAEHAAPWLYGSFAVSCVTGVLLFLYDPVHVGSHAYFTPKLILLALGLANAAGFHRTGYAEALTAATRLPAGARWAGLLSLALWVGVMVCAGLNGEAAPRVLLR